MKSAIINEQNTAEGKLMCAVIRELKFRLTECKKFEFYRDLKETLGFYRQVDVTNKAV